MRKVSAYLLSALLTMLAAAIIAGPSFAQVTPPGTASKLKGYPAGRAVCPFAVTSVATGAVVGEVFCDGGSSIVAIPQMPLPCGNLTRLPDAGILLNSVCSNGALIANWTFVDAGIPAISLQPRDAFTNKTPGVLFQMSDGVTLANLSFDGTSLKLDRPGYDSDYFTSDAGFCFPDHTCQTTAAGSPALPETLTNGTVTAKFQAKNGGLWLGSSSAHDLYLGTSDGFGFLQGNASQISLYAPVEMGNRQITGLGAATSATGAAIRNQTILVTDPASGSQLPVMAHGKITLSTGTGNHTFAAAFSAAPDCTWGDNSAVLAASCSATTTAITCTGTGSDVVSYICVGLP